MSNYTTQLLPFSPISGKKVEADFDGGEATSDAGVLLLRETEAHVGILSAIASAIHDLRDLRYVDHYLWDMIAQQQLALFNAYYDSRCYLPLHVYEGLSGKLITSILRPGSRPTGKQVVAILKRIVKRIRVSWPDTIPHATNLPPTSFACFCIQRPTSYCTPCGRTS